MLQNYRNPFLNLQKGIETVSDVRYLAIFKKIFFVLSRQSGCPDRATKKYFHLIEEGIAHNGAGYLKVLAAQPILGLRLLGGDVPNPCDYGLKIRKRTGRPILFAWHYSEIQRLSLVGPTEAYVLSVRRLLTILSIGKMLTIGSTSRINNERKLYAKRAQRYVNYDRAEQMYKEHSREMRKFIRWTGYSGRPINPMISPNDFVPVQGRVTLDPRCYSLKSLSKRVNRCHKFDVPEPVQTHLMNRGLRDITKGFYPRSAQLARMTIPDGKQSVIVESGGKFRGITSYFSPLVHSSSVYTAFRSVLAGCPFDCSIDQAKGHRIIKQLTLKLNKYKIISADASNFTDTLDIELLHAFLRVCGEDGFLEYLGDYSVLTSDGLITSNLPLMGLKGCFESGCALLAFSLWKHSRKRLFTRRTLLLEKAAHCCDDFAGYGTLEQVASAYNFIGVDLNYKKTVCSHTVAVFCGEYYWHGKRVTPIRLNLTTLANETDGTVLLPALRNFIDRARPVWGHAAMRCVEGEIRSKCIKCVGAHNVRFNLPTILGGIPLLTRRKTTSLCEVLSIPRNTLYALYNTPLDDLVPDRLTTMIGLVRLGSPVVQPDGTVLPSVTLPTIGRASWIRRKTFVREKFALGQLTSLDVLEYYYS